MVKLGIDVSHYQGKIDFQKIKEHEPKIEFVIIHAGYGRTASQKDPYFEENYANAKKAGLDVGAYWFSYASDKGHVKEEAEEEAQAFMNVISGKQFEYPVYLDLEYEKQFENGIDFCSDVVKYFCSALEQHRYYAGLYISRAILQAYIHPETARRYSLWIAEYSDKCRYDEPYDIWQKTDNGNVEGISENVDIDECYTDFPKIIKEKGLNGF